MRHPYLRVSVAGLSALVLVLAVATAASGHPKVHESVKVQVAVSAEKAADGTITEKVTFTASNPRCFSAKSFKRLEDGYFHGAAGDLLFNHGQGIAEPPERGFLHPASKSAFGKSPYIWEAVYPGVASIAVEEPINSNHFYTTTIGAATEASIEGRYPRFTEAPYLVKYTAGGKRHIVSCSRAAKAEVIEL